MNPSSSLSFRNRLLILLSFLVLVILAFPDLFLKGWVPVNGEVMRFVYPNWTYIQSAFHAGHPPLWNPYRSMGEPFLADPRSMAVYPFLWLTASAGEFSLFLKIWILIHTALCAYFAYRLANRWLNDPVAAMTAAVVAGFNGFFLTHAPYPNQFATAAWIPAVFYFLSTQSAIGLGLVWTFQWMAGYPPFFILSVLMAGIFSMTQGRATRRVLLPSAGWALGFSAVQWIPFLELLFSSTRPLVLNASTATEFSVPLRQLLKEVFVPQWSLRWPGVQGDPVIEYFYVGIIVLALAVWAVLRGGRRERVFGALAAGGAILSLGEYLPGYRSLVFLHVFRFPASWLLVSATGIAFLSALGISRFKGRWKWLLLVLLSADLVTFVRASPVAWFAPQFFDLTPSLAVKIRSQGWGRLYSTDLFKERWLETGGLKTVQDYDFMKATLTPSIGMAYGVYEVNSYQIWRLKTTQAYLDRLAGEGPGSKLLSRAGVREVVTLSRLSGAMTPETVQVIHRLQPVARVFFTEKKRGSLLRIDQDDPGEFRVGVQHSEAQTLIFSEAFGPGWKVTIDQTPAPLDLFESALMAVQVPAGTHEVRFHYQPWTFSVGLCLTLWTLGMGLFRTYKRTAR
jgi:hypothetical protein